MNSLLLALLGGCVPSIIFLWLSVRLLTKEVFSLRRELNRLKLAEFPKQPTNNCADKG